MKKIRPDYYNKFTCIADKCPITCCKEWKIAVDADTNRKWKKLLPPEDVEPKRKNLSAYTMKKDGGRVIELKENHKCPFLNENKLCKLVTAYGEKVLSETCTVFPREVHRYEAHEEETLMPCCPAVIDILYDSDIESIRLQEFELEKFPVREQIVDMLADESYSTEEALLCAFYIISELLKKEEGAKQLVPEYFSAENKSQLKAAIQSMEADIHATMEEENELLLDIAVNYQKEGLYQNYLNPILKKAEELSKQYETVSEEELCQFRQKLKVFEALFRKFLINEINSDFVLPGGDLESMVIQFQWIAMEYAVIKQSIFLKWLLDGKKEIAYETVRDYIVIICRMTGYDEEDIYEYLENSFESLVWDWGYLSLIVGK